MYKNVLLTGATGFLGSRLCRSLLERSPGKIYCLVRGRTPDGGERRLHARLQLPPIDRERIVPVAGDVRVTRFGMTPARYDELANTIDTVYHCAASVNLAADYDRLEPSNVGGTQEVLRFVQHRRTKHLHHVSTAGIFIAAGQCVCTETGVPSWEMAGGIGYCQTKFIGETEVRSADVPATIYRPGLVLGDTVTGECSSSDAIGRMIRAAAMLRTAAATTARVPVSSVDFTAHAIAALSLRPDSAGQVFHPLEIPTFPLREMFEHLQTLGYVSQSVSVPAWHHLLSDQPESSAAFVMLAVWRAARHILAETPALHPPLFDATVTTAALAAEGVHPSPLDISYFQRMFTRLVGEPATTGTPKFTDD